MPRTISLILSLLALTAAARAADKPADHLTAALREAEAEYNLGQFRAALERFEALYKETGKPALLFNVAQCHRQLGELKDAEIGYRSYLRLEGNSPNAQVASALLAQVIEAQKKEAAAKSSPPLGLQTQTPPPAAPQVAVTAPLPAPPTKTTHPVAGSVTMGAAAICAIAGAVFGAQSRSAAADWRAATGEPAWSDARSRAVSAATRANVAFVAAGVLAAAGAALLVVRF